MVKDYCGIEPPIALYTYDNWTHMPTSNDQLCIEDVLSWYVNYDGVWLHIGAGNHSLGKRFAPFVKRIDAITVVQEEIDYAPPIANYRVWYCDKHSPDMLTEERYDVIIDTTPCGHACCWKHFYDYLNYVFHLLKPDGVYLTDKVGLAWAQPTFKGMEPEIFGQVVGKYGMKIKFVTDTVMELTKCE